MCLVGICAPVVKKKILFFWNFAFFNYFCLVESLNPFFMKPATNFSYPTASVLFRAFLRKNRAYRSFRRSFILDSSESLLSYLDRVTPALFFGNAFIWRNSPEGYRYWYELNAKWIYVVIAFKL